jgi:hypothetical protein
VIYKRRSDPIFACQTIRPFTECRDLTTVLLVFRLRLQPEGRPHAEIPSGSGTRGEIPAEMPFGGSHPDRCARQQWPSTGSRPPSFPAGSHRQAGPRQAESGVSKGKWSHTLRYVMLLFGRNRSCTLKAKMKCVR